MTQIRRLSSSYARVAGLIACLVVAGCASTSQIPFEKAILTKEPVNRAIEVQCHTDRNAETPAPAGTPWFEVQRGTAPILITAPHATKPGRQDGSHPFSDGGGTAALALLLHEMTAATVVYTTYASPSDPNYYDDNEFKSELARLLEEIHPLLVLDLHGSHSNRPYDVDLGTMNGQSVLDHPKLVDALIAALRTEGLTNFSNNFYSASKSATITKFVSQRGVPAIQLEISSTWLTPADSPLMAHRFAQLAQGLTRFVQTVLGDQHRD